MNLKTDRIWDLPLSNPFMLLTLGSFLGNLIICPLLYIVISNFRCSRGQKLGLNAQTIMTRRRRNAVSGRFNFLVWLSESLIFVISFGGRQREGADSCFTPVLYYVGIESNRERLRNFISDRAVMTTFFSKKMTYLKTKVNGNDVQEVEQVEVQ